MNDSYLVQRLCKPYKIVEGEKANLLKALGSAFSFGGGLINGELSKDAMAILKDIFRFDYMGSSEFEWGAVPKAISCIAQNQSKLISGSLKVNCEVDKWHKAKNRKNDKYYVSEIEAEVFYMCHKEHEEEVRKRITEFAKGHKSSIRTKECVLLDQAVCANKNEYCGEIKGWLELNNGFMFFIDKEMFEQTCKLFQVEFKERRTVTLLQEVNS